jgi:hypothetical protein
MSAHSVHPDSHTHGLSDNCPRCAEHAEHPFDSLDDDNLRALVARTKAWMNDEQFARSENEAKAMRIVETALNQQRRLALEGWIAA